MAPDQPISPSANENRSPQQAAEVRIPHQPVSRPQLSTSRPAVAPNPPRASAPVAQAIPRPATPVVPAAPKEPTVSPDAMSETDASAIILPLTFVSRSDISKCLRELEMIEDFFLQSSIRGVQPKEIPTVGRVLDSLAKANNLSLLKAEDRNTLLKFLSRIKFKAPVVHMSFPAEASGEFLAQILDWFRKEVHPHLVLHIGLQPELAAGCIMRTNSKYFDFSFRKHFERSKEKLIAALEAS